MRATNDSPPANNKISLLIPVIFFIGLCASILMFWMTAQGPGVSPDSTIYIETAQKFLGKQNFLPQDTESSRYPPVYPLLLSLAAQLTNGDMLRSSRLMGSFLFGVNFILFALAVYLCTQGNAAATTLAAAFFLSSAPVILVHSMVWSEAPFIAFSTAYIILISQYIRRPERRLLVPAALMAGLAAATRYAGIALLLTVPLVFILDNRSAREKIKDSALLAGIAVVPLTLWMVRNSLMGNALADRDFAFHPIDMTNVKNAVVAGLNFFVFPRPVPRWINEFNFWMIIFFIIGCFAILRKMRESSSVGIIFSSLGLMYSLFYIFVILVSLSFFDANTPLDFRILLPPFMVFVLAVITLAWSVSDSLNRTWIKYFFILLALFSVGMNVKPAAIIVTDVHQNGRGYSSTSWKNSHTISYLSALTETRMIYSNGPEVIRFLTGKQAVMLPEKISAESFRINEGYRKEINEMIQKCRKEKAVIVYFDAITWRWYLPSAAEIDSAGLPVLKRFSDGIIWGNS